MKKRGITPARAEKLLAERGYDKMTKLRVVRVRKGLSQNGLSEKSGVPKKTIQHYEQGTHDINGAKLKTLCALSEALDVKIPDIIEDNDLIKKYNKVK